MSDLLVVGSVAMDSIETPAGSVERALGGSAVYFSLASRLFATPHIVGVAGQDFGEENQRLLTDRGIDISLLEIREGRTFHWAGSYLRDLNQADTKKTDLNVFATFEPTLDETRKAIPFVFLGNIDPVLQDHVLGQIESPRLTAMDTMNYWIEGKIAELRIVLDKIDLLLINDGEAKLLSGCDNLVKAGRAILAMGPKFLVVKKGEHGVLLFAGDAIFALPAYPLDSVKDPTGAGDSFAGGFMGTLAAEGELSEAALRRACLNGTAVASFTVEEFGVGRLKEVTKGEIKERTQRIREIVRID